MSNLSHLGLCGGLLPKRKWSALILPITSATDSHNSESYIPNHDNCHPDSFTTKAIISSRSVPFRLLSSQTVIGVAEPKTFLLMIAGVSYGERALAHIEIQCVAPLENVQCEKVCAFSNRTKFPSTPDSNGKREDRQRNEVNHQQTKSQEKEKLRVITMNLPASQLCNLFHPAGQLCTLVCSFSCLTKLLECHDSHSYIWHLAVSVVC